jgi:threonine dehydrogenase-like Zn-dependent dehydrogenase
MIFAGGVSPRQNGGIGGLKEAPEAYRHFDAREEGWTKVTLSPTA